MAFVLSQIIGVIVIIVFVIAPHMKTKPALLLCIVIGNLLTVIEFLLLGAMTEVAVISISTVRSIVFFLYSRSEKRAPAWVFLLFAGMQGGAVFVTWENWVSLLMLFDVVQTYGQWQTNMKILRISAIVTSVPIAVYNILVGGYTGAVNQCCQAVSASIALWHQHYRKCAVVKE
ncbi:MAG: YgjV family protein [Firmicutes bacterium]|nr:YgjV family protein [Bacillota bacterium]